MRTLLISFILGFLIFNSGCQQTAIDDPNDNIQTYSLEDVGINKAVINEIIDSINTGFYPNRHSLLIYKDNKLVLENYFSGQDYIWGRDIGIIMHHDTVLHDMRSISKSVVSACIGIAIDQGKIKSADQKLFDFFNDYAEHAKDGKEELTLKHLLTMTSGLEWNEDVPYDNPENSEIQMDNSSDPIGFVLSRKLSSVPGSTWKYNGGTTEVLATIIKRATGKNVYEFAKEYLFKPMGINRSEWTCFPGTDIPAAASGLRLRSRDILKFGILYQNGGKWKNQQIIQQPWIEQSLTSQISRPDGGGYGYQFWVFRDSIQGKVHEWPAAVGNGDQKIFFDKKNNLIVVMTAGNYDKWDIKNNSFAILTKIYESLPMDAN